MSEGKQQKRPTIKSIEGRNESQNRALRLLRKYNIVFLLGPAGTGKTYLSVAAALERLSNKSVEKILLCRPAVEADGEEIGYLPGRLEDKMKPFVAPMKDVIDRLAIRQPSISSKVEILPFAYMRGRSIANRAVVVDEAQNITMSQMFMLLTRPEQSSYIFVCGDPEQTDLSAGEESGLQHAARIFQDCEEHGFGVHRFKDEDVVRSALVKTVLRKW
jgi:phosphate starvation-inducible PhoH-like protein